MSCLCSAGVASASESMILVSVSRLENIPGMSAEKVHFGSNFLQRLIERESLRIVGVRGVERKA